MTYNVFGGTLSLTQSINQAYRLCKWELLKRFSRSEVRSEAHMCTNVWMLWWSSHATIWRRGSFVFL